MEVLPNEDLIPTPEMKKNLAKILLTRWEQLMEFLILLGDVQETNLQEKKPIVSRIREILQFLIGALELQNVSSKESKRIIKIVEENKVQEDWTQVEFLMGEIFTKLQEI